MPWWMEVRCSLNRPGCFTSQNNGPMLRSFNGSKESAYQTAKFLRSEAFAKGWIQRNNDFICPNCQNGTPRN